MDISFSREIFQGPPGFPAHVSQHRTQLRRLQGEQGLLPPWRQAPGRLGVDDLLNPARSKSGDRGGATAAENVARRAQGIVEASLGGRLPNLGFVYCFRGRVKLALGGRFFFANLSIVRGHATIPSGQYEFQRTCIRERLGRPGLFCAQPRQSFGWTKAEASAQRFPLLSHPEDQEDEEQGQYEFQHRRLLSPGSSPAAEPGRGDDRIG